MFNNCQFDSTPPFQVLPEVAFNYARGLANELGVDVNMVSLAILGAVNTLLLNASCDVTPSMVVGNSLYLLAGAPPSSGKTPCLERLLQIVRYLFVKHLLFSKEKEQDCKIQLQVAIARQNFLLKKAAKESDEGKRKQFAEELVQLERQVEGLKVPESPLMGQMSLYSVIKELAKRDGVGANIDAEGGLFAEANSVAVYLVKSLLKAWDCDELTEITKKASFRVGKPTLTLATFWQDKPMLSFLRNSKYYDVGLVARILPYVVFPAKHTRTGLINRSVQHEFEQLLERIMIGALHARERSGGVRFRLSVQAQECRSQYKNFADSLSSLGGMLHEYPEIAGKLDVQAVKLAMVLHAMQLHSDSSPEISGITMQKACQLAQFFADQHARILGSASDRKMVEEGRKLIETLIQWRISNLCNGFRVEDVKRPTGYGKAKCEKILFWLQQKQAVTLQNVSETLSDGTIRYTELWCPNIPLLQALLVN